MPDLILARIRNNNDNLELKKFPLFIFARLVYVMKKRQSGSMFYLDRSKKQNIITGYNQSQKNNSNLEFQICFFFGEQKI